MSENVEKCNAPVSGKNHRLSCGARAVTRFVDYQDADKFTVPTCERHAKMYRKNPATWREEKKLGTVP